jgi:Na+-driven multidrug efflux pump
MTLGISCFLYLFRDNIPYFFTSDPLVDRDFTLMIPFILLNFIPDSIQSTLVGVLKGLGEQGRAA